MLIRLQLQSYKGCQAAGLGGALSSLGAMGRSAFALVLALALAVCAARVEGKVWGQMIVGMWC